MFIMSIRMRRHGPAVAVQVGVGCMHPCSVRTAMKVAEAEGRRIHHSHKSPLLTVIYYAKSLKEFIGGFLKELPI